MMRVLSVLAGVLFTASAVAAVAQFSPAERAARAAVTDRLPADPEAVGEMRGAGRIAFRQQPDGHSNALNWPYFLDFAARQWGL